MKKRFVTLMLSMIFLLFTATTCIERIYHTGEEAREIRELTEYQLRLLETSSYIIERERGGHSNRFSERLHVEMGDMIRLSYRVVSEHSTRRYYYFDGTLFVEDRTFSEDRVRPSEEMDFVRELRAPVYDILKAIDDSYIIRYRRAVDISELTFFQERDAILRNTLRLIDDDFVSDVQILLVL